jgi:phage shock protein A
MGLLDRMSRAASANFNSLLDKLDDPKREIELVIRDMEEQLRLARREIVEAVASEKQLRRRVEESASEIERWERRAELAVKHGDDALAREALRHKRRLLEERDRAEKLRAEQRGAALTLRSDLERMERTVEEVKAKRGLLAAKVAQTRAGGGAEGLGAPAGGSAFTEFRRMEEQIEGVEAAILAEREVNEALAPHPGPTGLSREEVEARFAALEAAGGEARAQGDDVDEELRALKARIRVGP